MTLEEYTQIVSNQIRAKAVRSYVERELHDHIMDEQERIIREGETDPEIAMARAIQQMGDPIEVGERLNETHRCHFPWKWIAVLTALLFATIPIACGLSLLTEDIAMHDVLLMQVSHVAVAFIAAIIVCIIDYSLLARWPEIPIIMILALMLVAHMQDLGGFVRIGSGAYSIVSMSVLLIPATACIIFKKRGTWRRYIWLALMIGVALLLQPHDIRAIYVGGTLAIAVALLLCHMERFTHVGMARYMVSMAAAVATILIVVTALLYSAHCYNNMTDGILRDAMRQIWRDSSLIGGNTIAQDALLGSGINSMIDGTVLGLAALYGKLTACGIVLLLLAAAVVILMMGNRERNCLAGMLMLSCGYAVLLQTLFSVMSCLAGVPFVVGLPFVSYGGTGFLVNGILVGLLLSVSNWRCVAPYEEDRESGVTRLVRILRQ